MISVKTLPAQEALQRLDLPALDRNLFSSPGWIRAIVRAYGVHVFVKYIERDGKIASYVFYSVVNNFLEWKICVLSYCDYCDGQVTSIEDWRLIFEDWRREYPKFRMAVRSLRDDLARQCGCFHELSREFCHVLDIQPDIETLTAGTKVTFRQKIRQASKKGVTVRLCSRKELWDFYCIHAKLRKTKYHIFAQPFFFFEVLWEEFVEKDRGFLLGAFSPDGKMVGATLYLICGDTLYYKVNTSDPDALEYRSSNLLFWEGLLIAKKRGLSFIDLGSSGLKQDGLVAFKDSTGARRMEIIHIGYHPRGYRFSQRRILKLYTKIFNAPWVPAKVACWGSQFIYPFLA